MRFSALLIACILAFGGSANAQTGVGLDVGSGVSFPAGPGDAGELFGIGYEVHGAVNIPFRENVAISLRTTYDRFPLRETFFVDRFDVSPGELDLDDGKIRIVTGQVGAKRTVHVQQNLYVYLSGGGGIFRVTSDDVNLPGTENAFRMEGTHPGASFGGGFGVSLFAPVRVYVHSSVNLVFTDNPITYWPVGVVVSIGGH